MAPNLLVPMMKANPLFWLPKSPAKIPNLHFQREPVPGIYHVDSTGHRWLVAIKSNFKKDIDHIFIARIGFNENPRQVSASSSTTKSSNTTHLSCTQDGARSPNKNQRSITFTTNKNEYRIHSKEKTPPCGLDTLSSLFEKKRSSKYCKIDRKDCFGGYKRLARPLRANYNNVLKRWMFAAEIEARTCIINMCASGTCMSKLHRSGSSKVRCDKSCGLTCGTLVGREIFALDDGRSWVIIGDLRKDGAVMKRWNVSVNSRLYSLDGWAGIRRQTPSEVENSIRRLVTHKGNIFSVDGKEEYVSVIDYLRV